MTTKKKAFTLVELLAVIVILAILLVMAVPKILEVIKASKVSSMEDSAKLIAKTAEQKKLEKEALGDNTSISCSEVAEYNSNDYDSCNITFNNGVATINLKGKGKFDKLSCTGTKDNMECIEGVSSGYTDAVEYLTNKYNNGSNSEGLVLTHETELRYQGADPNNYVYFNCSDNTNPTESTCEIWRIVGVFNNRVKLVRNDSIGEFSWDSSESTINEGSGVNEWSQADLMTELNGDYLDTSLTENTTWYNWTNNAKTGTFNKNYVLKESSQEMIDDAVWYLGAGVYNTDLETQYANERGNVTGKICTSRRNSCNDTVTRTTSWTGKVGLIYPSDYGYASGNSSCATSLGSGNKDNCKDQNWLFNNSYYWTISPRQNSSNARSVQDVHDTGYVYSDVAGNTRVVRPSVYLISDIQIKALSETGTAGSQSNPYVFAN